MRIFYQKFNNFFLRLLHWVCQIFVFCMKKKIQILLVGHERLMKKAKQCLYKYMFTCTCIPTDVHVNTFFNNKSQKIQNTMSSSDEMIGRNSFVTSSCALFSLYEPLNFSQIHCPHTSVWCLSSLVGSIFTISPPVICQVFPSYLA